MDRDMDREISSLLCDHLEGWDREGDARGKREEIWEHMYMYN